MKLEDGQPERRQRSCKGDLTRLASFGANIADAHSCFIFLPNNMPGSRTASGNGSELVLAGCHSLSDDVAGTVKLPLDNGIIGWVARHRRPIHASPFDRDSRTLGIYTRNQQLKSFIGIPVLLGPETTGVLACDSKKSFAFSRIQEKLLENLSAEVASNLKRTMMSEVACENPWQEFLAASSKLVKALGLESLEVLRLKPANFEELERLSGTSAATEMNNRMFRLIKQALPPHFPIARLANGDIIVVLDNMMAALYENKIKAVSRHVRDEAGSPEFLYLRSGPGSKTSGIRSLDDLISLSAYGYQSSGRRISNGSLESSSL